MSALRGTLKIASSEDVRIADGHDYREIWRLLKMGHAENGMFPYDADRVDWWLVRLLCPESIDPSDEGPRGVIGVIGKPGFLEAMTILTIGGFWYTSQRHLEEFIVYVVPEFRRRAHHRALIEWMKEQSRITGLPLMTGILSTQPRTEAKVRLYEQMLPKAGAYFCFNPLTQSSTISVVMH